jgi:hypothetical protein
LPAETRLLYAQANGIMETFTKQIRYGDLGDQVYKQRLKND